MPRLFAIDSENAITAFPTADSVPEGQQQFASEKDLANRATDWPAERLVNVWNSFAGVAGFGADLKPVKKFTDRKTAVKRIWNAIQKLDGAAESDTAPEEAASNPKAAKGARKGAQVAPKTAKATQAARAKDAAREGSKKAIVIEMLRRKGGATLAEIMETTSWQAHSVRGFISIAAKKLGLNIESTKNATGERTYHATK